MRIPPAMGFIFLISFIRGEIITADRRIDWEPGIPGGIPEVPQVCSVTEFGAKGDGITDDFTAFDNAIKSASTAGAVFIPAGTYIIKSTLTISRGVVLRGAGYDKTKLHFDFAAGTTGSAIFIGKYARGPWVNVTAGHTFGSSSLTVADPSSFSPGDFAEIQQDNDSAVMYTDPAWNEAWAANSVGQLFTVTAVTGNVLTVNPPLRHDYKASLNPQVRTQGFTEYGGVERLYLKLLNPEDMNTIEIKNAAFCWVRECESESTYRCHVAFTTAYRCEVRGNYFHQAHDYGGGGHGYGVCGGFHVTDCLIEDNVFEHLRHSMMVQTGANGNVFGYNYSWDPISDGTWTPCDISLHGHYPYLNLFEGNVVQEIDISDYWGPCGPGNTFLRNRVEAEGIEIMDQSHYQNVVGNEIENGQTVRIESGVNNSSVHGNYVNNALAWDSGISDHTIPASYYYTGKPAFFGDTPWPVTGADLAPTTGTIPAQQRYQAGTPVVGIGDSSPCPGMGTSDYMEWDGRLLYDLQGRAVDYNSRAVMSELPSGIYLTNSPPKAGKIVHLNR